MSSFSWFDCLHRPLTSLFLFRSFGFKYGFGWSFLRVSLFRLFLNLTHTQQPLAPVAKVRVTPGLFEPQTDGCELHFAAFRNPTLNII